MLLKSEKNILQIYHLIFWMLQVAKYLIHDFTFTFSFFFICSHLNWTLFRLSGIFGCKKKWWTRLKFSSEIFDVEKMRDRVPKSLMSQLSLLLVHSALSNNPTNTSSMLMLVKLKMCRSHSCWCNHLMAPVFNQIFGHLRSESKTWINSVDCRVWILSKWGREGPAQIFWHIFKRCTFEERWSLFIFTYIYYIYCFRLYIYNKICSI